MPIYVEFILGVIAKAKAMALKVLQATKDALGVKSPSREIYCPRQVR